MTIQVRPGSPPLGQERVAEHAPVRYRGLTWLDPDDLHADMVSASLDVGAEFPGDGVQVAPEHEVVDEAVAAAVGDVVLGVAQPAELRDVVRAARVQVDAQV